VSSTSHLITNRNLARLIVAWITELIGIRGIAAMVLSSFVLSLVEFVGLALIFPFLKLVTDPAFRTTVMDLFARKGLIIAADAQNQMVVAIGFAMVLLFVAKGALQVWLLRFQARIAANVNRTASQRLLERALYSRFQLFQEHGAVKLAGISQTNTTHASLLFLSATAAINEIVLLGFVFVAGFALAPLITLAVIGVLFLLGAIYFRPLSHHISIIGAKTQDLDHARHRFVFAMATAIRDIKIMGLESVFAKRNLAITNQHVDLAADYGVTAAVPRISIEVLMVCGVVFASIWLVVSGRDLVALAPALATFALMAMRAAPSLSRLANSYNGVRYSLPFVETLLAMWRKVSEYPQVRIHDGVMLADDLQVSGLSFGYGQEKVLKDISLVLPKGRSVAVIGASGSGKSTLLDLIAGLQKPHAGTFSIGHASVEPFASASYCSQIGYVPQAIALFDSSLAFNIALEESPDTNRLEQAIRQAHLTAFVIDLPQGLETILGEAGHGISGGQRQRIGIARALYRQPALLILDEVTSALDPMTQAAVMNELFELRGKTTLLIVTHDIKTAANADYVYRLDNGELQACEGKVQLNSSRALRETT